MTRAYSFFALALASIASVGCTDMGLEMPNFKGDPSGGEKGGVYHRPVARTTSPRSNGGDSATAPDAGYPGSPPSDAGRSGTGWTEGPDVEPPPLFANSDEGRAVGPPPPPPPAPYGSFTTPPAPPRINTPEQVAPAAGTSDADPLYTSYLGRTPPDFGTGGTWVTPASQPTLASMRGQVVFLVFSFQQCEGCKMFMPSLQQWAQQYQPRGATIIYVDNGVIDPLDYARKAVKEQGVTYAYFHDPKAETIKAYGVRAFPTGYLIGKDGTVLWEGTPTAQEPKITPLIEAALAK